MLCIAFKAITPGKSYNSFKYIYVAVISQGGILVDVNGQY